MSMHLEGPWLSTTGRRKGKFKWASAEQKREQEKLQAEWQSLKERTMTTKPVPTRPLTRALPRLGRHVVFAGRKGAVSGGRRT